MRDRHVARGAGRERPFADAARKAGAKIVASAAVRGHLHLPGLARASAEAPTRTFPVPADDDVAPPSAAAGGAVSLRAAVGAIAFSGRVPGCACSPAAAAATAGAAASTPPDCAAGPASGDAT